MARRGLLVWLVVPPCQVWELNITTDPAGASIITSSGWGAKGSSSTSCGRTACKWVPGTTLVAPFSTYDGTVPGEHRHAEQRARQALLLRLTQYRPPRSRHR